MNGVLALETADPGPITDRIAATFRLSALPCAWLEGPDPSSPALGLHLMGLGYRALEGSQGWALPTSESRQTIRSPPGILYRHGQDPDLLRLLGNLVGEGALHLEPAELRPLESILEPRRGTNGAREEIWVALHDGEPVAGMLAHSLDSTLGIFALATAPERRGQGFASALVLHVVREAADAGARWAVAESPEAHAGPYRRLGFQEYCDFRRYGWEPHPAGSPGP
ncbi:MAG: GNAT family N-acetyltransferase [Thermoplasmata archaeon]|nr:GNAT family N-acetyltransferase [Thermoplasmata archaeon]